MKLLIVAGGGGHFAPALAVLDKLPKEWEVLVVGRKYAFEGDEALSFEYQTAQKLGIPFTPITTGRLQRKLSTHTISSLLKIPVGLSQATKILKDFKPDVVLSFGGYIAVPIAVAAKMQKIPIVLHEQTLQAGLSNKIVSKFADKICISWKYSEQFFPKDKTVLTGNPLRKEFFEYADSSRHGSNNKHPLLYVTGGSGGAHGINLLVEGALEKLLENYLVIHQTGSATEFGDYDRLQQKRASFPEHLQKRYELTKFVPSDQVVSMIQHADLVIARSGIGTVSELLYLGKPCMLIPLPYGQQHEQLTNAQFVQSTGLGEVFEQDVLTPELFVEKVQEMLSNIETYKSHAVVTHELIDRDAADKIIEIVKHETKA
ncbi:MAG: UDP-N-acetylglucosamine--N-acetylmuramyl-(pentapeptide) pyrophosphoryl-undecaprenol N-acetylglucosamine transferase [Candidatus Levybacteria bacterium]|nr:UDP-N-acetylglucosamine--N-acetylmuramyl-(pentapeptide) pyrophosphoryl-undecaprenol N-acetylglucosamine transferase [Candidatus Levybacteria bacterium]